jgi:hypothetical protein
MNTRKYPRTMQEAFGPYTSFHIDEPKVSYSKTELFVFALSIAVGLFTLMLFVYKMCAA